MVLIVVLVRVFQVAVTLLASLFDNTATICSLFLIWYHPLLHLGEDGEELLGCSLHVADGLLELVHGAKTAQAVHGLVGGAACEVSLSKASLPSTGQTLIGACIASYEGLVLHIVEAETLKSCVCLLLAEKATERAVSALTPITALVLKATAVVLQRLLVRVVLGVIVALELAHVDVCVVQLLPLHVELAELVHIIDHVVAHFHSFSGLLQGILVPVNLRKDGAVL